MHDLLWVIEGHGLEIAGKTNNPGRHPTAKSYSDEELRIAMERRADGWTWEAIAEALGRDASSLRRRLTGDRDRMKKPKPVRWLR
jgi:hypothetical protein